MLKKIIKSFLKYEMELKYMVDKKIRSNIFIVAVLEKKVIMVEKFSKLKRDMSPQKEIIPVPGQSK